MKYNQGFSKFYITEKNAKKAAAALRERLINLCDSGNPPVGMSYFRRVMDKNTQFFDSYMTGFGWTVTHTIGIDGYNSINYTPIGFVSGNESMKALEIIAPYVEPGSYIEMSDKESRWRYRFDGEKCIKEIPEITWIPEQETDYEKE